MAVFEIPPEGTSELAATSNGSYKKVLFINFTIFWSWELASWGDLEDVKS